MWIVAAIFSALFAGLTSILSKCGVKNSDSNVATAIRTSIVLLLSWLIVFITKEYQGIVSITSKSLLFLILSGIATGASWICYFKALSIGEVSKVSAVDKSSLIFSILFAMMIFPNERTLWWLKIICICIIGIGTFLMCDLKKNVKKVKFTWFFFALLSALFAAATSILAKIGIENVASNLATAIRTGVVFILAWLVVLFSKNKKTSIKISSSEIVFLFLSGITTALSWLCYYYAIKKGQVSVVVPIDKLSIVITIIFSIIFLKEKLSLKSFIGLILLICGTIIMAIFTS